MAEPGGVRGSPAPGGPRLLPMIILHALWNHGNLHLFGERPAAQEPSDPRPAATEPSAPTTPPAESDSAATPHAHPANPPPADTADSPPAPWPLALPLDDLRRLLGDFCDGLLISGAKPATLELSLPRTLERFLPSADGQQQEPRDNREATTITIQTIAEPDRAAALATLPDHAPRAAEARLAPCAVPTLVLDAADAYDLLTSFPDSISEGVRAGDSLRYWRKMALFVTALLARQRFVPALHHAGGERFRAYWRIMVEEDAAAGQLHQLIAAMPPVCLAHQPPQPRAAASVVDNYLWSSVDTLVRRCLEGDELVHAIHERSEGPGPLQMRWLRALVGDNAMLDGPAEQVRAIYQTVHAWLSRLDPQEPQRAFRTCLRLEEAAPEDSPAEAPPLAPRAPAWRLSFQLQPLHGESGDPIDARTYGEVLHDEPAILERPLADGLAQLRADLAEAARFFPLLAPCAAADGPLVCPLSLEDAHRFLRDAAPMLEAEGFSVHTPRWWRGDRPRLRMFLEVRPAEGAAPVAPGTLRLDALVEYDWRVALGDDYLSPEEIAELARAKEPLVQLRGRWLEARPAELQAALAFLRRTEPGRLTLLEALRLGYTAEDIESGLPLAGLRAHGWIERFLQGTAGDALVELLAPPPAFHGELRPYQLRGLQWLAFLSGHGLGACLADDMGLGKTIQLIALLLNEREREPDAGPTLLVVPMSLVGNWQRELHRFAPSLRVMVHHGLDRLTGQSLSDEAAAHDVVIVTYGLTHRDFEHLSLIRWRRIALDEAQNIKNPAAKQAVAVRNLPADHRLALTGTPVENRLSELWSIMDFLNPGYLGTATDFRRRFAGPIERRHDTDRMERLRSLIRPFVLRRLKDDPSIQVDLPEKLEMTVFCNLTREQAALYEAVLGDMMAQIERTGGIQRRGLILATLMRLKQICNHPAQFLGDGSALTGRSGKCERLTEMLDEVLAEGHRALVFTQFREMGHLLERHLAETLRTRILYLHGGTSQPQRDELVDRFQTGAPDTPILLLSLKAGGLGLNLTAANHVFHYDRWWNPAVEDQATDRAHRIGQIRQVQVHKFVCIGTLEERIAAMIDEKRSLARQVITGGEEWITELSTDALRDLFTLSREAVADD